MAGPVIIFVDFIILDTFVFISSSVVFSSVPGRLMSDGRASIVLMTSVDLVVSLLLLNAFILATLSLIKSLFLTS